MTPSPQEMSQQFQSDLRTDELSSLFNLLPDVYFVVKNRNGQTMMANELAVRLCGLSHEEEMVGKTDFDLFSAERAETYVKDDRHVLETGERIIDRVELAPDPHNSINWFATAKIPLYSKAGEIIGLACIARNTNHSHEKLRPYLEMNEVLEFIRVHYAEPIKLEELANLLNLSTSQFERRFKKVFQITPTRHIQNVRLRAACNLLTSTHDTIASIAHESGFYDHSHFVRTFKKTTGLSPGEYRKRGKHVPW